MKKLTMGLICLCLLLSGCSNASKKESKQVVCQTGLEISYIITYEATYKDKEITKIKTTTSQNLEDSLTEENLTSIKNTYKSVLGEADGVKYTIDTKDKSIVIVVDIDLAKYDHDADLAGLYNLIEKKDKVNIDDFVETLEAAGISCSK